MKLEFSASVGFIHKEQVILDVLSVKLRIDYVI
jgi:hypothetical protein